MYSQADVQRCALRDAVQWLQEALADSDRAAGAVHRFATAHAGLVDTRDMEQSMWEAKGDSGSVGWQVSSMALHATLNAVFPDCSAVSQPGSGSGSKAMRPRPVTDGSSHSHDKRERVCEPPLYPHEQQFVSSAHYVGNGTTLTITTAAGNSYEMTLSAPLTQCALVTVDVRCLDSGRDSASAILSLAALDVEVWAYYYTSVVYDGYGCDVRSVNYKPEHCLRVSRRVPLRLLLSERSYDVVWSGKFIPDRASLVYAFVLRVRACACSVFMTSQWQRAACVCAVYCDNRTLNRRQVHVRSHHC